MKLPLPVKYKQFHKRFNLSFKRGGAKAIPCLHLNNKGESMNFLDNNFISLVHSGHVTLFPSTVCFGGYLKGYRKIIVSFWLLTQL